MNKFENKGSKIENIQYQLNINDIINKIKKEFEQKIKDKQFYYKLIETYISLTNDYKNKIENEILVQLENKFDFFGQFFSFLRQLLEIQKNGLIEHLIILNKIFKNKVALEEENSKILNEINKLQNLIFDNDLEILNKKHFEYINQLKIIENNLIDIALKQKNKNINEKEITKGKNCHKAYLDIVNIVKNKREIFLKDGNNIINNLISINKKIYENFHIFLNSIIDAYSIKLSNEKMYCTSFMNIFHKLQIENYIQKEIKNIKTIQINNIEFEPYKMNIFTLIENEKHSVHKIYTSNICLEVISKMKKDFDNVAEFYDVEKEEKKNIILQISKYIVDPKSKVGIPVNQYNSLIELLNDRELRLLFMTSLNKIRVEGHFEICEEPFNQLGKIIKFIFEKIKENKDYDLMRYEIIMCQTYYYLDHNNKKIYLLKFIQNDEIFHSKKFWKIYIGKIIEEEGNKNSANNNPNNCEINIEPNLVFSKLLSMIHNMFEFKVSKNKIIKVLNYFGEQYKINKDMMDNMFLLVNNNENVENDN